VVGGGGGHRVMTMIIIIVIIIYRAQRSTPNTLDSTTLVHYCSPVVTAAGRPSFGVSRIFPS